MCISFQGPRFCGYNNPSDMKYDWFYTSSSEQEIAFKHIVDWQSVGVSLIGDTQKWGKEEVIMSSEEWGG